MHYQLSIYTNSQKIMVSNFIDTHPSLPIENASFRLHIYVVYVQLTTVQKSDPAFFLYLVFLWRKWKRQLSTIDYQPNSLNVVILN